MKYLWIYIFRENSKTKAIELHMELECKKGQLFLYKKDKKTNIGPTISLEYKVKEDLWRYFIFPSRIRVTEGTIKEIAQRAKDRKIKPFNLSQVNTLGFYQIIDPLARAFYLQRKYQWYLKNWINYIVYYKGNPDKEILHRLAYLRIAEILSLLIKNTPKLEENLDTDRKKDYEFYRTKVPGIIKEKEKNAELAAKQLIDWLKSEEMAIVQKAALSSPRKIDRGAFFTEYNQLLTKLEYTKAGQEFLKTILQNKNHFINKFFLYPSEESDLLSMYKTASGLAKDFQSLVEQFFPLLIKMDNNASITIAHALNNILGECITVRTEKVTISGKKIEVPFNEIIDGKTEADAKGLGGLKNVNEILKPINFVLTLFEYKKSQEGGYFDSIQATLTVGKWVFENERAFTFIYEQIARKAISDAQKEILLKRLNVIGYAIDTICSTIDASKYYGVHDGSAFIGASLTSVGSVMAVLGVITGGVLLPVGVVVAFAGGMLATFTKDSDLVTFIKHCTWGTYHDQEFDLPKWAGESYPNWKNPEQQLRALYNLVNTFEVVTMGEAYSLRITNPQNGSIVYVTLNYEFTNTTWKSELVISIIDIKKKFILVTGKEKEMIDVRLEAGELRLKVRYSDLKNAISLGDLKRSSCQVYVDTMGNGKYFVPSSGKSIYPVQHTIYDKDGVKKGIVLGVNLIPTSSKNF